MTTDEELAAARAAELVEVVNRDGRVERIVTRREMRRDVLRHRCTYVVVINSSSELVVHQRAFWKEVYPGYWDLAFGGVCGVGEDWVEAAARELDEEAGLGHVRLNLLGDVAYDAEDGKIVGRAYAAHTDQNPLCEDGEVIGTDRVPLSELSDWLKGRKVAADSAHVLVPLLRQLGTT